MEDDLRITFQPNVDDGGCSIMARIPDSSVISNYAQLQMVEEIVHLMAKRYVEENYADLVNKLDQQAIANLAIAEAGKKIAEEIRAKPTVLHDKETKTVVYERSIFGGTRRVG